MRYENLHNHTTFSDGQSSPEQIIKYAIELEMDGIGISDHYETEKVKSVKDVDLYFEAINELKLKYKDKINVYSALEIDFSERTDFKKLDQRSGLIKSNCDYLLFEYVGHPSWSTLDPAYFFDLRKEFNPLPVGLAHTFIQRDLLPKLPNLTTRLIQSNVFIELCAGERNLYRGEPNYITSRDFLVMNRGMLYFTVASDTHKGKEQIAAAIDAYNFIKENGLKLFEPEIKYPGS